MRIRITLILAVAALFTAIAAVPAVAEGASVIPFEKEFAGSDGALLTWRGTAGDGTLVTTLARDEIVTAGQTWHVRFDWYVTDPDFTADVGGTINLRNGNVAMSGTVTDGVYEGARIIVRAQLDLDDLSSAGTMLITPSG